MTKKPPLLPNLSSWHPSLCHHIQSTCLTMVEQQRKMMLMKIRKVVRDVFCNFGFGGAWVPLLYLNEGHAVSCDSYSTKTAKTIFTTSNPCADQNLQNQLFCYCLCSCLRLSLCHCLCRCFYLCHCLCRCSCLCSCLCHCPRQYVWGIGLCLISWSQGEGNFA